MFETKKLDVCENCGATFIDGQYYSWLGKPTDPRYLSARICSAGGNETKEKQLKCLNPLKNQIPTDSVEFGFPKK